MTEKGKLIKQIFDPYFNAPLEIWESFATFLKQNSFKKNEIIKDINKKEKYPINRFHINYLLLCSLIFSFVS